MKLEELYAVERSNSKIEKAICDSLKGAADDNERTIMSSNFIINAINIEERKPEETAMAFQELFKKNKVKFEGITTFSYYISALQFWSYLAAQNQPDKEMKEVIDNVEAEIKRCKNILFFYVLDGLDSDMFTRQVDMFRKNFNVSDLFHSNLGKYLLAAQEQIVEQLLLSLSEQL